MNIWAKLCGGWRSQEENYGCRDEEEVKFVALRQEGGKDSGWMEADDGLWTPLEGKAQRRRRTPNISSAVTNSDNSAVILDI